jgi:hypothetical protein
MSTEGPKPYPVVFDPLSGGLEYSFQDGYYLIPLGTSGITQLTGDVTAGPGSGSQVATIAAGAITNAKVSNTAAIAFSKLASLSSANILVGNGSNVATAVPVSGDVTLANTGAFSLVNASVTGQLLTGYVSGSGTISATDSILSAFNKLNGNDGLKLSLTGGTLTGALTVQKAIVQNVVTLATTGTITPDATVGPTYETAVSGNITLNGPSSPVDGQKVTFRILNDASHSVTLSTGSGNFRFGTDIPSYINSVSKTDYIGAIYNSGSSTWDVVSLIQGF